MCLPSGTFASLQNSRLYLADMVAVLFQSHDIYTYLLAVVLRRKTQLFAAAASCFDVSTTVYIPRVVNTPRPCITALERPFVLDSTQ